jgi:hypothetical protein
MWCAFATTMVCGGTLVTGIVARMELALATDADARAGTILVSGSLAFGVGGQGACDALVEAGPVTLRGTAFAEGKPTDWMGATPTEAGWAARVKFSPEEAAEPKPEIEPKMPVTSGVTGDRAEDAPTAGATLAEPNTEI